MPTLDMPDRPNLDSFRRQARALQRAVRAGDPDALERLARHHPDGVPAALGAGARAAGRTSRSDGREHLGRCSSR